MVCFAKNALLCLQCYGSSVKLDAAAKIISVAAFPIIGLTKIPKIEFLSLDWIYHSIRIMTVNHLNRKEITKCLKINQLNISLLTVYSD